MLARHLSLLFFDVPSLLPNGVPCASFLLGSAKTAFSSFLFLQLADRHLKHSFIHLEPAPHALTSTTTTPTTPTIRWKKKRLLSWKCAGSPCSFRSLCSLENFTLLATRRCCQAAYRVRASCSVPRKQPFPPSSSFNKPTAIRSTPSSTSRSPDPPLTLSPRRRQHRQQQQHRQHQQTDGRNWLLSWNRAGSPCSFRSLCSLENLILLATRRRACPPPPPLPWDGVVGQPSCARWGQRGRRRSLHQPAPLASPLPATRALASHLRPRHPLKRLVLVYRRKPNVRNNRRIPRTSLPPLPKWVPS